MASGWKDPPDAPLVKHYKCHPNSKVGAMVCIVCGNFYHTAELVAKHNTGSPIKFIDSTFVICQEHANLALTSNVPYGSLSKEAMQLIANLKLEDKEQIKQDILKEIVPEKNKETGLDETVFEDYTELEALKIENNLLKQLYQETQEKNEFLKELLVKEKQTTNNNNININNTKSFAEIVSNTKPKAKRVPKLIIKRTNSNDSTNLERKVIQHLTNNKTVQTRNIISRNKDMTIINCTNEESINKIEQTLKEELKDNFKVEKEQIKNPTIKIVNINSAFTSESEIEEDINQRNFNSSNDKCKVLHNYTTSANTTTAIVEVTSEIYKRIKENNNKIFVGYQSCRVFDIINTNPCPKCSRFGHSAKKCPNKATCNKCAGEHTAAQCQSKTLACPNCDYHNKKFNTKYNINHSAIDSDMCEVLKKKINKYIEMTDYPTQPTYQRYFGNIERPRFQRSVTTKRIKEGKHVTISQTTSTRSSIS
jgi:hypothetical protein